LPERGRKLLPPSVNSTTCKHGSREVHGAVGRFLAVAAQISACIGYLSALCACSRALMRFLATAVLCKNR
jgi:hypothetical protein